MPIYDSRTMSTEEAVKILAALGVSEISFTLEGGGDEGTIEFDDISWLPQHPDGTPVQERALDTIPHFDGNLLHALQDGVSEWPDNWADGEGGYGNVTIRPFAEDPAERIDIAMVYRDGEDHERDDDDELGGDLELDDDDADGPAEEATPADPAQGGIAIMDDDADETPAPGGFGR